MKPLVGYILPHSSGEFINFDLESREFFLADFPQVYRDEFDALCALETLKAEFDEYGEDAFDIPDPTGVTLTAVEISLLKPF